MRGKLGAWCVERLGHFTEDVNTAFTGLFQRLLHNFLGHTGDFDIHLQRSDTLCRTGHLEVHITQMILITEDIGQDSNIIAFLDQTHGNPGDRFGDRHTGIHQRQGGSTDRSHRGRPI